MRKVSFAAGVLAVLMFAALPGHAATQTVMAAGETFIAPIVVAHAGDVVALQNIDPVGVPHTLTLDSTDKLCKNSLNQNVTCDTGSTNVGATKSFKFSTTVPAGQYTFKCILHAQMHGVIVIQ